MSFFNLPFLSNSFSRAVSIFITPLSVIIIVIIIVKEKVLFVKKVQ